MENKEAKILYHKFDISGTKKEVASNVGNFEQLCSLALDTIELRSTEGITLTDDSKIKALINTLPEMNVLGWGEERGHKTDIRGHGWDDYTDTKQPREHMFRIIYPSEIPVTVPAFIEEIKEIRSVERDDAETIGMFHGRSRTEHYPSFGRGLLKVYYAPSDDAKEYRGLLLISPAIKEKDILTKLNIWLHSDSINDVYPATLWGYAEHWPKDAYIPESADNLEAYAILFSGVEPKDKKLLESLSEKYTEQISKKPRTILKIERHSD